MAAFLSTTTPPSTPIVLPISSMPKNSSKPLLPLLHAGKPSTCYTHLSRLPSLLLSVGIRRSSTRNPPKAEHQTTPLSKRPSFHLHQSPNPLKVRSKAPLYLHFRCHSYGRPSGCSFSFVSAYGLPTKLLYLIVSAQPDLENPSFIHVEISGSDELSVHLVIRKLIDLKLSEVVYLWVRS